MSIKREVIAEIKERAKKEEKTISALLAGFLQQPYSNREENDYSKVIATAIKELKDELKTAPCSNIVATGERVTISEADIKKIAGQMELAIGMYIENGVAKGIKDLR